MGAGQHRQQGNHTMRTRQQNAARWTVAVVVCAAFAGAKPAVAQTPAAAPGKPTLDIYGFGQADAIVDFKKNNPDWFDVNRPSKLPSFSDEFGENGHFYLSA